MNTNVIKIPRFLQEMAKEDAIKAKKEQEKQKEKQNHGKTND